MRQLIESLKRLYINNRINIAKIEELKTAKKITEEEYNYILEQKENSDISAEEFLQMVEGVL